MTQPAPAAVVPATCEVWVDGKRYLDGRAGEPSTSPVLLSGLTVTWGRSTTVDQPEAATASFTIQDPPGGVRFDATVQLGSSVVIWALLGADKTVVFGGRVTDLTAEWDDQVGTGVCQVIAADLLSDLANRFVGTEPWAMQLMKDRAKRILQAVGVATGGLLVAARPGGLNVSRLDVDRQAAGGLLVDLATSTGAVLWAAYDPSRSGPYLYFEDPSQRASLYVFAQQLPGLKWKPATGSTAGTPLSACQVLLDPARWDRSVTDLFTRVTVRWKDQTTSPDTTERTAGLTDTAAEKTYGARGLSVGTELTSSGDATALATGLLAAHQPGPAWRTSGLVWDLAQSTTADEHAFALALALLGNVTRLGYAIALTDLPYWTPTAAAVQLYVEGGVYTFDTDDAGRTRWVLALTAAPSTGLGGSLTYGQTDLSIRYLDVDRTVTFLAMVGVGPAGPTGPAWSDIPGATTWASVPADIDWSEDPR